MTDPRPSDSPLHFDFSALPPAERYKLVTGVVVPRPIAWVSTLNPDGSVNLAPYSFFGLMGSDPAVVAFAPGDRVAGVPKDTARNIGAGGEFVVNLVSAAQAHDMNLTATDFPAATLNRSIWASRSRPQAGSGCRGCRSARPAWSAARSRP